MNNDLRKLLEHIDQGGETVRKLDLRTGRIVSVPVIEGEIGRKIGSTIGGIFGKEAGDRLGRIGSNIGDMFGKSSPDKSNTNKPNKNEPGNISDFSSGSAASPGANRDSSAVWAPDASGRNADGSYNSDSPFAKAMDKKMAANKNPNGNGGHDGSGIDPNADPADPKLWPPGIKPAADFGYLDPQGMWIPTPFHYRTEEGKWRIHKNSPGNLVGIPANKWTPFQQKLQQMQEKVVYLSSAAIEKQVPMKLPGGAPQIPGYRQIDASRFSTDAREPGLNKTLDWIYAYQSDSMFSKKIILIASMLFPNMKISIGRYYDGWEDYIGNIRSGGEAIKTENGTIHVAALMFNHNDVFFDVVIHSTDPDIGPKILQNIKI